MTTREIVKLLVLGLAGGLAGVAVVATVTDRPPAEVGTSTDASPRPAASPAPGRSTTGGGTAATSRTTGVRSAVASRAPEAFRDERYRVRAGDTLWDIATRHYEDATAGMEGIKRRNRLRRDMVFAGELLVLPAAGRRSEGSRADESCQEVEAATDDAPPSP